VCSSRPAVTTDTPSRTSFARWWWVLGVDRDHPGRPDQDVVDVGASVPNRDRVQHPPRRRLTTRPRDQRNRVQLDQELGDGELAIRPDPPRPIRPRALTDTTAGGLMGNAGLRHVPGQIHTPNVGFIGAAGRQLCVPHLFECAPRPRQIATSRTRDQLPRRRHPISGRTIGRGSLGSSGPPESATGRRFGNPAGPRPVRAGGWAPVAQGPPGPPAARFVDTVQRVYRHWSARSGGAILGATIRPDPGGPR
jgi:hypothetical protein